MEYFTFDRSSDTLTCADAECECGKSTIPEGGGYLYVSPGAVRAHSPDGSGSDEPLLICEVAARRRDLDMETASEDAAHWWKTGSAPLRATPRRGLKFKEFKGKTPEEAKALADAAFEPGKLMGVKMIKEVQARTGSGQGATAQEALKRVRDRVPEDAFDIGEPRIVQEGASGTLEIEASSELDAKSVLRTKAPRGAQVDGLDCKIPAKNGFLGMGKVPGVWAAQWSAPFIAEIEYKLPAVALARYFP